MSCTREAQRYLQLLYPLSPEPLPANPEHPACVQFEFRLVHGGHTFALASAASATTQNVARLALRIFRLLEGIVVAGARQESVRWTRRKGGPWWDEDTSVGRRATSLDPMNESRPLTLL